jgi:ectoine hydroxylase-related dioxygenase (phytanoyl-CoA dioxygenase family)
MSAISAPVKGFLTQEEIEMFFKQGYLVKKQGIEKSQVAALDQMTLNMIDKITREIFSNTYPCSPDQQITHINGSQVVFKKPSANEASILRVVGSGGIEPNLLTTLRSHQMATTFFDLLGCNDLEHIICSFHPKQPKDGVTFVKHRDIQYRKQFDPEWKDVMGNGSYAICILAIDAMSAANGGLYVDRSTYPPKKEASSEDVVSLSMEPGDLLFMHPEILHWSDANVSEVGRRALLTGFCAWGANHKAYPGTEINVRLTRSGDDIQAQPVFWNKKDQEKTVNH